jgi:hypothetical protein
MRVVYVLSWWLILGLAGGARVLPQVRDHREVPGAAAQWTVDGDVDPTQFQRLYNTSGRKHLVATSSTDIVWADVRPGDGKTIFENCTRPGEAFYSSDRVAIRFGTQFLVRAEGTASIRLTTGRSCDFRLVPSRAGFVTAGSGDGKFAIYNISANRYLVYKSALIAGVPAALTLRWQETSSGRPPSNVAAYADLVPVELFFTEGMVGNRKFQTVHLSIKNAGKVGTSRSQQDFKLKIRDEELTFVMPSPLAPGGTLTRPFKLAALVSQCERVVVELDTNTRLKFQVGAAAFPNDEVFANDRAVFIAKRHGPTAGPGEVAKLECEPVRVK